MKVIKHNLPEFDEIRILPLADLHLGDIHSDFRKIQEWLDYILNTENVYTILNGDLMDTATRQSIGDVFGASIQPMEQLKQCVKLFEPIKDKILAVTPGNHERRVYKTDGLDMTQIMCNQLGIGDRYSPASALLFVRFGKSSGKTHERPMLYTIYCVHGSGGGRLEGGKINRLIQLASIVDADIFLHSHTHLPAIVKNAYYRVSGANSTVQKVDRLFINTSSALDWGGYGELQSCKPNSMETPIIILDGHKRNMRALL